MQTNSKWMLIPRQTYHRMHVADALLRRLLDTSDGTLRVGTQVGQFKTPDDVRCLAREWLALGGTPSSERQSDPAVEGVAG